MKKLVCVFISAVLLFASCSNAGNVTYTGAGTDTLKQVVKNKEDAAIWTRELESVRLTKNLSQIDSVSDSIKLSTDIMKVSHIQGEKIYPKLMDFGSLDVSEIPENVYQTCQNFSVSFSKDLYSVQSYFVPTSLFSYVFFLSDLGNGFFKDGLPEKSENEEISIFDRYLIGRPYESGEELQIPIRFYKSADYIDIEIFISTSSNLISQIRIERWMRK